MGILAKAGVALQQLFEDLAQTVLDRARWQVELLFKRWKSPGLAAELSGSTVVRQRVRVPPDGGKAAGEQDNSKVSMDRTEPGAAPRAPGLFQAVIKVRRPREPGSRSGG